MSVCRLGLETPERDAITKIVFLSVFYSPLPFLLLKIFMVTKNQISALYSKQHQQQLTIANGLAQVLPKIQPVVRPQVSGALSANIVKLSAMAEVDESGSTNSMVHV